MGSLRRLAKDHASLHVSLPPNYLFPPSTDPISSLPDDLTQLMIYVTGAIGTPYAQGLWLLHLRMPTDYPKSPPKATFKTRIFHPNVDENTGSVCLETLKRDWDPKLTLKDILVTISCLLIQPNPDSALNEKAGVLVREDYAGFERQAKLMTKIHAPIPPNMKQPADEARSRGEDPKVPVLKNETLSTRPSEGDHVQDENSDSSKENELSSTTQRRETLKRPTLGKRPLAELPIAHEEAGESNSVIRTEATGEPVRKSPKHTHIPSSSRTTSAVVAEEPSNKERQTSLSLKTSIPVVDRSTRPPLLKIGSSGSGKLRTQARIGIRRL